MFTKKNILIISGLIGGGLLLLEPVKTSTICGIGSTACIDAVFSMSTLLFVFPFVFLFSLITYKMRDEVSRAWITFTKWWVPAQILLVAFTPESSGGYFVVLLDKQFAAIILSGLFLTISLFLIIYKYFSTRRPGQA